MAEIAQAERPLDLSLSEAELEATRAHITDFVQSQVDAAGVDEAIIALSGGIDSTLTSHLLVEALGPESVHGLVMPSRVNPDDSMSDAERVAADLLEIDYDVVEIGPVVDAFLEQIPRVDPENVGDEAVKMAVGNMRARTRAVLSYFEANRRGAMVIGTGNRSEAMVGYFTKYGDGAVDCHPIANLYKGQVRQLAAHVGVPEDLVEKPASAELWEDHSDEGELGIDYDTLDSILALAVDGPLSPTATARTLGVEEALVDRVRGMVDRSVHKRQVPPGPDSLF